MKFKEYTEAKNGDMYPNMTKMFARHDQNFLKEFGPGSMKNQPSPSAQSKRFAKQLGEENAKAFEAMVAKMSPTDLGKFVDGDDSIGRKYGIPTKHIDKYSDFINSSKP